MSNLLTGIAPAASAVAQSTPQTTVASARSAEGNSALAQQAQRTIASGALSNPAVLVSISAGGQARSPSFGEGRSVDAGFEKQEAEGKKSTEKGEGPKGRRSATVNVTA